MSILKKSYKAMALAATAMLFTLLFASGCAQDATAPDATENEKYIFATGGESGTYYAFGSVLAQHATNNAGLNITAVVGNGSEANIYELQDGNAQFAFCQSDVMSYAYEGSTFDSFKDQGPSKDAFSVVAALYDEQVQIVTCDPNIKSVADLKGKKVSIGASGSGVYFNAIDILSAYGIDVKNKDIEPTFESFADSADSLKDGKIDAAFIVAGAPTTAITDLSVGKQTYLVSLDDEHADKLVADSPYYTKTTI
ncbi:MAG: TAXI family TRAP transporter solute-binding subunit, partial [Eggerthellaceae bacterium]|nr:TAXI family TRAP transporter solute-binding subunit [Eggerthellaceae bacterium]